MLADADATLLPAGTRRSPWLREALAAEGDPPPLPPLVGSASADVAIVGGGYTGLWTALQLGERAPQLRITVLEQDICGGGPSGRNGGFVNAWWDEIATFVALFGPSAALAAAREVAASVHAIGAWCEANAVDAHYRGDGMLMASTTPLHDGAWEACVEACRQLGVPEAYVPVTADAVQAICSSPRFRGGALMADAATVQPALLARGLRRVALERGITIHEGSRVVAMDRLDGPHVRLRMTHGELVAPQVVLAINAWAAGWRPFRNRLLAWSSWMVRSEPIPHRVERDLGWTSGTSIVDARFTVHYLRTTRDGRIALGAGGGRPGYGGRIGRSFINDLSAGRRAVAGFRHLFPSLGDVRLTDMWGGPIDVSPDHVPRFGTLPGGRVHYGFGYSGNGVGPSHLGGRILAALVLGSDEPVTRLPIVGSRARPFPPEPFRYVGARALREAMIRREDIEEAGRRAPWWLRQLTAVPRRLGYHLGPGT
jgi:glycine/D-amino acid oxidase-like deaminating enzyme